MRRHPLIFKKYFAFPDHAQCQMRQRREIATRANAALFGNGRMKSRIEHGDEQLREIGPRTGIPLRDDVGAQQHHRAYLTLGQRWSHTSRVTSHEIHLQLGETIHWNGDLGELPEPSRHPVRYRIPSDQVIDDAPGSAYPLARSRRQFHGRAICRDREHVLDAKRSSVDHD